MDCKFFDLDRQYELIKKGLERRFSKVLEHKKFVNGPEALELEKKLSAFIGCHAAAVNSGTSALLLALMAMDLKPGDEVITSPLSFSATAFAVRLLGAVPVFVDIEEASGLIKANSIEKAVSPKTKAILPVSLYGQPADMDLINKIAKERGLKTVEDACQSFGALYKGKKSGSLSDYSAVSFFPAKPLGAYGSAGCAFAKSPHQAEKLKKLRNHGQQERFFHQYLGFNGLISSFQAAVLLEKLKLFERELKLRQDLARRYDKAFKDLSPVVRPIKSKPDRTSSRSYWTALSPKRDKIMRRFKKSGCPLTVHYPIPLFDQPALKNHFLAFCDLKKTREWTSQIFSLPLYPYLKEEEQDQIIKTLKEAL